MALDEALELFELSWIKANYNGSLEQTAWQAQMFPTEQQLSCRQHHKHSHDHRHARNVIDDMRATGSTTGAGTGKQQGAGVAGNHKFLVGRYDPHATGTLWRTDDPRMSLVALWLQRHPQVG